MRGEQIVATPAAPQLGITSACAGSSCPGPERCTPGVDHPRVRGEQDAEAVFRQGRLGSPPPARRVGDRAHVRRVRLGITPACAGSRPSPSPTSGTSRDHPRLRGAQRGSGGGRTRRWIIPACAGSSGATSNASLPKRDHPCVRGEQFLVLSAVVGALGSPPRARGADDRLTDQVPQPRITPACGGSRGGAAPCFPTWEGSPPRARGADRPSRGEAPVYGITPACAGSRMTTSSRPPLPADHPRMRGEQHGRGTKTSGRTGSPPHARGAGRA